MVKNSVVLRNEEDVFKVLRKLADETFDAENTVVKFDGWPKVHIIVRGDKYHQSITPSMMKGFMAFQSGLYRSYALARYNSPDVRQLSDKEREELEISVKVSEGSSDFSIDLQELVQNLGKMVVNKMSSAELLALVLGIGVLWAGTTMYRAFLEERRKTRKDELDSEERVGQLEVQKFMSAQETERAKIIAQLAQRNPQLENIRRTATDAKVELLKSLRDADSAEVQGIDLTGEMAGELVRNARRQSEEVRLDGEYRILRVDSSNPEVFRVKVKDVKRDSVIDAAVQDTDLKKSNREALQAAEWGHHPVRLKINAKSIKGELRAATIIDVEEVAQKSKG